MLGKNIRTLLLIDNLPDGKPPFESAKELAQEVIIHSERLGQKRSLKSVTTLISAIFLDRKPCSKDVEKLLEEVVSDRFQQRGYFSHSSKSVVLGALRSYNSGLQRARNEQSQLPEEIQDIMSFFSARAQPGTLVVVEYRDLPRTFPHAKYESLLRPVAETIVKGANLAMFQPFQSVDSPNFSFRHAPEVTKYLRDVFQRVRLTYLTFRKVIRDMVNEQGGDPNEVLARVRLYERNSCSASPVNFLSGIQSRMFYTFYPKGQPPYAPKIEEAWEWVAGLERDYFIQREQVLAPILAQQFFPAVSYWQKYGKLPLDKKQLRKSIEEFNTELGADLPSDAWVVRATDTFDES